MTTSSVAVLALSFLLAGIGMARPIIIRHDVPDSLHVSLGARYADIVADLKLPTKRFPEGRSGNGVGVLLGPRWVLTAAHVAAGLRAPASGRHRPRTLTIGRKEYAIDGVFLHPDWREEGPADIALIHLKTAVSGSRSAVPYQGADEVGKTIIILGWGDFGTGVTGPARMDQTLRGATNRIEEAAQEKIVFLFDAPETTNTTDLEGISGPGDSGGPALLESDGTLFVLGVSVAQDGRGHGRGRYGAAEYYTRVSSYTAWIKSTMDAYAEPPKHR